MILINSSLFANRQPFSSHKIQLLLNGLEYLKMVSTILKFNELSLNRYQIKNDRSSVMTHDESLITEEILSKMF